VVRNDDGSIRSAARWYWPVSTLTEVVNVGLGAWTAMPVFTDLHDDPDWEPAEQRIVDEWVSSTVASAVSTGPSETPV
jgi:hypothetical protein